MNGTNFINGMLKAFQMHILITFIYSHSFIYTVFRWRCYQAVVLGCGNTTFTFEVVLTSPTSYAVLVSLTDIHCTFQSQLSFAFLI